MKSLLAEKKRPIMERWFELILDAYPADIAAFLKGEPGRLANPAGYVISHGLETLFDELTHETDSGTVISTLDSIIRIQGVQNFSTFQAVTFVFLLKKAIREELGETIAEGGLCADYLSFEARVDAMAVFAFDAYVKLRDEAYRGRIREIKAERDRALKLLTRGDNEGGEA
jgi:hypothetical protein